MLTGSKVVLRRVEPSDHPDIQRWQNDPEVFYWMDYERPFDLEDIRRSEQKATEEGIPFIIEVDGRPIGRIGLNNMRPRDGMASFYVFVGERTVWGHRYGLDAVFTILRHGFEDLSLRKIELWTLATNARAIHMYKSAGFVEDGLIPERSFKDGVYLDHLIMSVDRVHYEAARASAGL